jgi:hypothetical protein
MNVKINHIEKALAVYKNYQIPELRVYFKDRSLCFQDAGETIVVIPESESNELPYVYEESKTYLED